MNRIPAGAKSRFGYLFGSAAAKPAPAAKAKTRSAQPGPAARPATSKPEARPTDFSHLLKASRARGVELPEPGATTPKPRTLAERHRALLRARGETIPEPVDALPEQPQRRRDGMSSLSDQVAALQAKFGVSVT